MPHYMFTASLSEQGLKGILEEGAGARMQVVRDLFESLGGGVEAAYWAFGESDFIVIAELPDNAAAAAAATAVVSGGTASVSTTVLLTADDLDEARGRSLKYRPPGR